MCGKILTWKTDSKTGKKNKSTKETENSQETEENL